MRMRARLSLPDATRCGAPRTAGSAAPPSPAQQPGVQVQRCGHRGVDASGVAQVSLKLHSALTRLGRCAFCMNAVQVLVTFA
eukprot:264309-Chlamydomonas_euryale.AAC.2